MVNRAHNLPHGKDLPPLSVEEVREVLRFIPPPAERVEWLKHIAGVAAHIGPDAAETVLNEWNPEERAGLYRYELRRPLRAIGQGFLPAVAKAHGWTRDRSAYAAAPRRAVSVPRPAPAPWKPKQGPEAVHFPTLAELDTLRRLRALGPHIAALHHLADLGILRAGEWGDLTEVGGSEWVKVPVFILQDGGNAMVRRMDAPGWNCILKDGKPAKNRPHITIEGRAKWPIGASAITADTEAVLLLEGVDMLAGAAAALAHFGSRAVFRKLAIVASYSAAVDLHPDSLPAFKGKHVRIVPHMMDKTRAGEDAAKRWKAQLEAAGATVSIIYLRDPSGEWAKQDLNDAVSAAFADLTDADAIANPEPFAAIFAGIDFPQGTWEQGTEWPPLPEYRPSGPARRYSPMGLPFTSTADDPDFADAF